MKAIHDNGVNFWHPGSQPFVQYPWFVLRNTTGVPRNITGGHLEKFSDNLKKKCYNKTVNCEEEAFIVLLMGDRFYM